MRSTMREDLMEYFGYTEEEIQEGMKTADDKAKSDFKAFNRETHEDVCDYYAKSEGFFFLLLRAYNLDRDGSDMYIDKTSPCYKIASTPEHRYKNHTVLDYGCGLGIDSEAFYNYGWDVTLADIPGLLFNFTKYRWMKQGKVVKFINVHEQFPVKDSYDVIICNDVLEHIKDPDAVLGHLYAHLNLKGILIMEVFFDWCGGNAPEHLYENYVKYNDAKMWRDIVDDIGFECIWRDENNVPKIFKKKEIT